MAGEDKLKRSKCFPECKKVRKKVKQLVRKAKKNTSLSVITVYYMLDAPDGHRSTSADVPKNLTRNICVDDLCFMYIFHSYIHASHMHYRL